MELQQLLFQKEARWIRDYEIRQLSDAERTEVRHFSGVPPLSKYHGTLSLTDEALFLASEQENLVIPLEEIQQIYQGFDDCYTASSTRNFGVFWQPIRLTYRGGPILYLIVGYNGLFTFNKKFFELLKDLLS